MRLSGKELGELRAVVLEAITDEGDLARLVRDEMDVRLQDVVKPGNLTDVVDQLLVHLESTETLVGFIDALTRQRPQLEQRLRPFRDRATAGPKSLERLRTQTGRVCRWVAQHRWAAIGIACLTLALLVGGGVLLWPRDHPGPPDYSEPLTPVHAPEIWKKSFVIRGQRIAYASPDTTYEVLEERLNKAEKSILIAVYEFTSVPVKELVLSAVQRGVKVTLLLGSRWQTPSPERPDFIDELAQKGVEVVEAPRWGNKGPFSVYHPRVIVIDRIWTLVQTGNLTPTSVPPAGERSGNRDTGIAIESPELADYFVGVLTNDKRLLLESRDFVQGKSPDQPEPKYTPFEQVRRFKVLRIGGAPEPGQPPPPARGSRPIRILPVLTPDNYVENLTKLFSSARESVDIGQMYISSVGIKTPNLRKVLDALNDARARNPKLMLRVLFGTAAMRIESLESLREHYDWLLPNVRILSSRTGLNMSNKIVIVDRRVALLASANWSEAGVARSRETGIMIDSPDIAEYFGQIFDEDWKHVEPNRP
jgi:phosphatidylserine/phosphatidylglycerophosphate/cardiolipin synthase-like enzyme